ncbi:hypothetical protein SAY87_026569 [Trapa incisa]|uniref:Uncharacterized protein n=1 Tax=Trapa incisa TaxID=236973 RepID=A0AAN7GM33_9MYRT|nr:hypothetical protein SAY87_026569 [Trapa incisa]
MLLPHIVHASATGRLAASPLGRSIQHPRVRVLSLLITIASTVDIEWRQWLSLPSVVTLQGEAPLQISLRSRSSLIWLHLLPSGTPTLTSYFISSIAWLSGNQGHYQHFIPSTEFLLVYASLNAPIYHSITRSNMTKVGTQGHIKKNTLMESRPA